MKGKKPLVGIIMGSDSDLDVMSGAAAALSELNVPHEVTIVSAHRTPERLVRYAEEAEKRGLKVIIAGAGGAAHLPGMTASISSLPVIGVPVRSSNLQGLDSLLSIVQMPSGVPVATVAINGGRNAGILAAEILALSNADIRRNLVKAKKTLTREVQRKAETMEKLGWKNYKKEG